MKVKKFIIGILAISLISVCLTACGSSVNYATQGAFESMYDTVSTNSIMSQSKSTNFSVADERNEGSGNTGSTEIDTDFNSNKIIYNGGMRIDTSDIVKTEEIVLEKIKEYRGYIADYNKDDNSYIHISVRVPAENFSKMLDDPDIAEGNTVSKNMSAEDVTLQYSDTEAELESLKIQEDRLLTYLQSAENVSDLMSIENSLQNVRQQIATVTNRLKYLDSYISYSQLDIQIYARYNTPVEQATFGERIVHAFSDSWDNLKNSFQDFVIEIILLLPFLIFVCIVGFVIFLIIKKNKKNAKNKEKVTEEIKKEDNTESK